MLKLKKNAGLMALRRSQHRSRPCPGGAKAGGWAGLTLNSPRRELVCEALSRFGSVWEKTVREMGRM